MSEWLDVFLQFKCIFHVAVTYVVCIDTWTSIVTCGLNMISYSIFWYFFPAPLACP